MSLEDAARAIINATGQPVRYHDETIEEAYASRAQYGAPDWQVEAWVSTYLAIRYGEMERVTGDVEMVTGAAPMSFQRFLASGRSSSG